MKLRAYKNELEFADASRAHGPWIMRAGMDGIYMPIYADGLGIQIKYLDDGDNFEVSYNELCSSWRWQDITECGIIEK